MRYAATPVPLFFERGEGARLYDVDGNVHIDYVLGNGPAILGHAPVSVIAAVAASLSEGQVFAAQHPREPELSERLCSLLPGIEVVRFATSGTEAVLMALENNPAFHVQRLQETVVAALLVPPSLDDEEGSMGSGANVMDFPHDAHRAVLVDFLDAIEQNRDPVVTGEEALATQRLIADILQTAGWAG